MNIKDLFGAEGVVSVEKFTIYLPDEGHDEQGGVTSVEDFGVWTEIGAILLARVSGSGATVLPPAVGIWVDEESREPAVENTSLLYTYIEDAERFEREAHRLARFVHSFGSRTRQSAVFLEYSGEFIDKQNDGTEQVRYISRAYRVGSYLQSVDPAVDLDDLLEHLTEGLDPDV